MSSVEPTKQQENIAITVKPIVEADRIILEQLLSPEAAASLAELDESIQAKKPIDNKGLPLLLGVVSDRQKRGSIHQVSFSSWSGFNPLSLTRSEI